MFNQGLSLDQAPPLSVPFRFFLTAPLFGVLLGILFLFSSFDDITNTYTPLSIAAIHLFTLGVLSMIIFGALQQMMPVLAGVVIKKALLFAKVVHTSLILGTLALSAYFIFSIKFLLYIAILFLSISFLTFFIVSIRALFKVEFLTATVKAMRLFSISGLIVFLLGLYLLSSHLSGNFIDNYYVLVSLHILFAVFGFATLLIMGVSFQVIPMFYVTSSFPKFIENKIPLIVFSLLIISAVFLFLDINFLVLKVLFSLIFIVFAYYGLKALNNRRRPVFDVTLWYWKFSLSQLILAMLLWVFDVFETNFILTIVFALGFLYSLLQGMVYKIIPFLAWFHLSSKGYFSLPTIREFIDEKKIKYHFYVHCASILFFVFSTFFNSLIIMASILFIISNIFFFLNCLNGVKKYMEIAKTDPMDMSAFK